MKNLITLGQKYMAVEEQYILDRLSEDSHMTVLDKDDGYANTRVFISRVDASGNVYVKKLREDGTPSGSEYLVESGYYPYGCEYAELVI